MIRTLIVFDVPFYREALKEVLSKSGEAEVVGAVSGLSEVERVARTALPDVVLLDVRSHDALSVLRRMHCLEPAPKVVAIAVSEAPRSALEWIEAGVVGYVPRNASLCDLLAMMKRAVSDELYCRSHIASVASARAAEMSLDNLTLREREILSLVAQGLSSKGIARQLGIAFGTVKNHVHNILNKLNVRRRVEAASVLYQMAR